MLLVYYRDKDGAIVRHHPAPEGMTLEQLQKNITVYNFGDATRKEFRTAHFEEVEDGTQLAYMVQKAAERKKLDKEAVQYAIGCIEEALSAVQGLEV